MYYRQNTFICKWKIDRKAVEDWFERYRISEDKIAEKEETKTDLEK